MKIFIIHKWRQEYLLCCIKQLLKYNDAKDIVFLTDDKKLTKKYIWENDITYENISDYFKSANEFEKYYQHRSYNKPQYELFCFQRWLVINDYVNKHDIKVFCHIDSDVLLFCNAEKYYEKNLSWYDFCYNWFCWHTSFISKRWINEFSDFLIKKYKNDFQWLEPYFTWEKICAVVRNNWYIYYDKTNCVTDMTLFYIFTKEYCKQNSNLRIKDIWIIINHSVFDPSINWSDGFQFAFWLKRIRWNGMFPYCYLSHKKSEWKIFFNALHFQGETKIFMKKYYDRNFSLRNFLPQFKYRIKKWFIEFCEFIFRILWIHSLMRDIRLKIIRRWVDPKGE